MTEKVKHISEQKLKAFSIGAMGKRPLSKKELEEQRKKEEEEAAAHVFQEFVETFQESPSSTSKVWVKAGTYDAGARKEDTKEKGKLYKPQSRLSATHELASSAERAQAYARMLAADKKPDRLGKKKAPGKSNLELFKEELKLIQEEREERHKYKGNVRTPIEAELDLLLRTGDIGSFDTGDPTTTNIYLGNLNPKITEQQLLELFGRFGPLASIKIMWPRSDEEKARCRNCGFVAYMSRKDGERAIRALNGKDFLGYEMKLGWGKSVLIPSLPIYIPPSLLKLSLPPPPSGLPFNAQPIPKDRDILPTTAEELNEILSRAVVKVVIPTDRNLLMLIHRTVEFVIREGPMFEAMIMNREISNPMFRFLFENQSPAHTYYRWKLYSIMHGESQKEWRQKEFQMFKGGSIWKPPIVTNYTNGMPEELILEEEARDSTKGSLSATQRDRLEDIIRNLTPENKRIGEAMVFCIEHSDAADEVSDCLLESLSRESTALIKKIARLYLISDILHNCGVKVLNASFYRKTFEVRMFDIIQQLKQTHDNLEGRLKAEGFKIRVLRTFKSWEDSIYPKEFMTKLHNAFLGLEIQLEEDLEEDEVPEEQNWDGNPLQDRIDDEDDTPMDGAALLKNVLRLNKSPSIADDDIDGFEIPDEEPDIDKQTAPSQLSGFIVSKWETVDPDQVEAQAMTTSKWDLLESSADNSKDSKNDTRDSMDFTDPRDMTEDKRTKLREIEVKAMHYQDELESGQRLLKSGWTVPQQVAHYRRKLLKKSEKDEKEDNGRPERHKRDWEKMDRDTSEEEYYKESTYRKNKKHSRSSSIRSSSKHRSKSRSPSSRKKSSRAVSPPSPPRIRRHSPSSSKSRRKNSISPDSSNSKYSSPSFSKYGKYSPNSPKSSRHSRKSSPSPVRYRTSDSPPSRSRHKDSSPTISRRHKHKHRR